MGPSKTSDGIAILHNGPQQGFNNPAFVTAIGLHGAGYDLTGMTPIGLLPVLFGTDGTIAWAVADLNARYFVPSSNRPPPRFLCQTWHERQRMHSSLGTCV
nr:penicillin acylase family protein [Variovorax sp. J31P179]